MTASPYSSSPADDWLIQRLQTISNAFVSITSELDLELVLQRIADAAREVANAKYAAMGIVNKQGLITAFITSGISKEEREKIGELPRGHGLLGVLIKQGQPVRVRDITKDPRRSGFPPHHPPMTSLLGVPVSIQGRIVGDLYLTDKIGADEFSSQDEWWLTIFARQAAVAVENANLYHKVTLAHKQAQTLAELVGSLNRSTEPNALFKQITSATCELLNVPAAAVCLFNRPENRFDIEAEIGLQLKAGQPDAFIPLEGSVAGEVLRQNKPIALAEVANMNLVFWPVLADGNLPASLLVVPIRQNDEVSGVIQAYTNQPHEFSVEEIALLGTFALKAALALEKAQLYRHKEDFLSMTAHDLRAPLTAIKLSASVLEASLPSGLPPALTQLVQNIGRNSERLNTLLTDLLDLTRLQQGQVRLNKEKLESGEAVAAAFHSLTPLFREKSQEVQLLKPEGEYWVLADRRRLEQVVVNLMVNANKYTPPGGQIWVRVEASSANEAVLISVRDSGPGIPAGERERIFERFYRQAVHEKGKESSGSGMGLAISRHLVELHEGKLWVESEPGTGSTFYVSLPLTGPKPG